MLVDYHVHTPYCGHAIGRTIEYVEQAIARGLSQLCFTDHLYRYYLTPAQRQRFGEWGMDESTVERYVGDILGLKAMYAGAIDIRIGLEVDYITGAEEKLTRILAAFPLDFVVGSIHCLPRFGWHHLIRYTKLAAADIYREYFECARAALTSGVCDSVAHLDFVWRNVPWPRELTSTLMDDIRMVVSTAAHTGRALEINANGYLWSTLTAKGTPDPFSLMVTEIARQKVDITIGSDAHAPGAVGASLDEVGAYLTARGISVCTTFRKRQRQFTAIG